MCIGIRELFFFIVLTLLSLYHAAFERVGAFHHNQRHGSTDWTDKWAPKIVEQAKLETSCSAASISCAQMMAL